MLASGEYLSLSRSLAPDVSVWLYHSDANWQPLFRDCTCSTWFGFNEVQFYLAAEGCSNNALKKSCLNIYFFTVIPTNAGVVSCTSFRGNPLARLRLPMRKMQIDKWLLMSYMKVRCIKSRVVSKSWGFAIISVRNHDVDFDYEHMFMIFCAVQSLSSTNSWDAVSLLCCGVRVMQWLDVEANEQLKFRGHCN